MKRLCRRGATAALLIVLFVFPGQGMAQSNAVAKDLHDRALAILHEALANGKEWVRVHAGESLLWTAHPEDVYETFVRELGRAGPSYRIGVWRVLAQAAQDENERALYRKKVLDAFLDPKGPDRLHAVETLGKLGYPGREEELVRVGEKESGSFQACARWVRANSGAEEDEAALAALLDSDNAEARGCAAYALRFFKTIRPATYGKLQSAAERESEASNQRANILSPWYVHAPASIRPAIKAKLAWYADHGAKDDKREMCAALGRVPDPADLPLLTRLLDDKDLDVRAAAAEAILRIERSP